MQCSMAWALHRTEKEKPAAGKTDYWRDFWRSGWDSNPRNLAVQLISSQSRYDHFDTAPYLSQHQHLGKRGELMGRTSKNIKLRIPEKPHKIKGFRTGSYRVATTISSRSRYDHFDTSPYMTASLLLRMEKSLVYYDTTSWKRQGETFRFLVVKKVHRSGLPLRWTDRANRFVLIHTHSSKRISYPASPMPLCRARCCRLALPTLAPAQDAQDSPAADHQHPCP